MLTQPRNLLQSGELGGCLVHQRTATFGGPRQSATGRCTGRRLRSRHGQFQDSEEEIRRRFNVPVRYVVLTHAHFDHIAGAHVFQKDGAIVVANQRALEPLVGESCRPPFRTVFSIMTWRSRWAVNASCFIASRLATPTA
jgi:glyoxylase-like metal-dependent hydrolase (beta-lactamase superfamily II)